ncbi:MAG: macro domain-containing protein [Oscillospiraceae bacterium]|nr:macro domain-containing protein [Oscillospiraceae bacterium]
MPFSIVRNDITHMNADAIVNTANPQPVIGSGTDARIHTKAGPQLLQARQKIGSIPRGQAAITPAYGLQAKYVIHTVGPVWTDGTQNEEALLRSCYDNSLALALQYRCRSVAFPLISTGNYGFPKDKALQIAIAAFSAFLTEHEMQIYLVVFDNAAFRLSEQLFDRVASYIDDNYAAARSDSRYRREMPPMCQATEMVMEECTAYRSMPVPKAMSLEEILQQEDMGFTEALLRRIDESGKKDSVIYKRANLSKQHFSKIRNNPHYKPTKATAIALAIALELDLADTRDLIGRAGFALTNSSKFDLIIRYFIQQRNYNIIEINMALYEFDQPLLGA